MKQYETQQFNTVLLETQSTITVDNYLKKVFDFSSKTESTDTLILNGKERNLVIEDSRDITHFLQTHPLEGDNKYVAILHADSLNLYAQQALLKTIEEPPHYAKIILHSKNSFRLLPTIRSRVRIIRLQSDDTNVTRTTHIKSLRKLNSISNIINYSNDYTKSRDDALDFTESLIGEFRDEMLSKPNKINLYNVMRGLYCHKLLNQNVQTKLALEELLLNVIIK